ncbi:MAG: M20/M25/M40 family metallo-hydrolase [Bdellovibrionota bacterium]
MNITNDFVECCRKFIELDSTPANGTVEIAAFAAELCRKAGLHVEVQSDSHNGLEQANVIARPMALRPDRELLLQTHLDTSDPGAYALWTKTGANPFNASIFTDKDGETLYGLGSANTKLDFLCKLRAIDELKGSTWRLPPVLVGTFGEELGMQGAVKLIRKKRIAAEMALIGEPTDLRLVGAGKGFAAVEIEIPFSNEEKEFRAQHDLSDGSSTQSRIFIGKAAHSSSPQFGDSAISKMLEYLTKLPDGLVVMEIEGGTSFNTIPGHAVLEIDMVGGLRETIGTKIGRILEAVQAVEREFAKCPDPQFIPAEPTLSIGLVRTFEDFVKFSGCCRLPASVTHEAYEGWMAILRSACEDVGAVFRVTEYKQPFRTPSHHPLALACKAELSRLGLDPAPLAQSVANEANVFNRFGISCVVFGPGHGVGNSHAPNEHVRIEQLHEATRFYRGVLERVCL